jgi:hypothetical protein
MKNEKMDFLVRKMKNQRVIGVKFLWPDTQILNIYEWKSPRHDNSCEYFYAVLWMKSSMLDKHSTTEPHLQ